MNKNNKELPASEKTFSLIKFVKITPDGRIVLVPISPDRRPKPLGWPGRPRVVSSRKV